MSAAHQDDRDKRSDGINLGDDDPRTAIDSPPAALIGSPLEFLFAEHLRQRQFAKLINLIADGVINRRTIVSAIKFVENDLARHILDEEVSFFPLLRPQCDPEDRIDSLLSLLADEHREDEAASENVLQILHLLATGGPPSEADSERLRAFADHLKRHLALENGVLLPLARGRMTAESLRLLSQSISMRRGGLKC